MTRRVRVCILGALISVVTISVLLTTTLVRGYDQSTTHRDLAEGSIELVYVDPKYQELQGYEKTIVDADEAEDDGCRSENHFFNPQGAQGVALNNYTVFYMDGYQAHHAKQHFCGGKANEFPRYQSALDWANDGMPSGEEKLDWHSAIDGYDYTPESKLQSYKGLGHVLHLLQDMGQPDHAQVRPHPCGYVPGLDNRLSYETLWATQRKTWPKGTAPKKIDTLQQAFTELAHASQQAEENAERFDGTGTRGLPFPDEASLGCRTIVPINGPNYESVKAWLLSLNWPLGKAAQDPIFAKYEGWPGLPAIRTIPPPPGDYRTRAYLELGKTMLPKVEEYGAGLVQFFQDIVNPPPFVEEVEIYQNGQQKYRKTWKDELTGDPPHIQSRHAEVEGDGELEAGIDAQVIIRIGPKDPDAKMNKAFPKLNNFFIRRKLKSLTLTIVPDGGKPDEAMPLSVSEGGEPNSPRGGIWKGHFTPSRSATLRIKADDLNEHYKDVGEQREQSLIPVDSKRGTQGDLDADPSTPARATWRESKAGDNAPPGAPYPWRGYEAGPDTNHHFTVRTPCGRLGQKKLEEMRWGTWTGTIKAVKGDYKPHPLEVHLSVSFRAAYDSTAWGTTSPLLVGDLVAALAQAPVIRLGRVQGSGTWTNDYQPYGQTSTLSGPVRGSGEGSGGHLDFTDPKTRSNPPMVLYLSAAPSGCPGHGCQGSGIDISLVGGDVCPSNTWRGKITPAQVEQMAKQTSSGLRIGFPGWTEVSWYLQFAPSAPPPHVTAELNYRKLNKAIATALGAYSHQLNAELMPILVGLWKAGKQNEAQRLHDAMYSRDNPCTSLFPKGSEKIGPPHYAALDKLVELWIVSPSESDMDLDKQYNEQLDQLNAVLAQWQELKRSSDAQCSAATETLATVVQGVSPNDASAVRSLRELAQKIRKSGIESLAADKP